MRPAPNDDAHPGAHLSCIELEKAASLYALTTTAPPPNTMPVLTLPALDGWLANLAGILPLSALAEFTDPPRMLHAYQLSGCGLLWNWAVTPAGARLLLSVRTYGNRRHH